MYELLVFLIFSLSSCLANSFDNSSPPKSYSSVHPSVLCKPYISIQYPITTDDLRFLVEFARENNQTLKALGQRSARTDIICTDGIPADMQGFDPIIEIDKLERTVKVGAGIQLVDLLMKLNAEGFSLEHMPNFGNITVGGALGTGAHGSSLKHPSLLADLVLELKLFCGNGGSGRIVTNPKELAALKLNLGLLGFVHTVKFRITKQYKVKIENTKESDDLIRDPTNLINMAYAQDTIQLWWFPNDTSVILSKGTYLDSATNGTAYTTLFPDLEPSAVKNIANEFEDAQAKKNLTMLQNLRNYHRDGLFKLVNDRPPIFTQDGKTLVNPATGFSHQMLMSQCEKCRWKHGNYSLYENWVDIAVPVERMKEAVDIILKRLNSSALFPLFGIFIQFSQNTDAYLGQSEGRDSVHFIFVTATRKDRFKDSRIFLSTIQAITQSLISDVKGRAHWGNTGLGNLDTEIIMNSFPQLPTFKKYRILKDPKGIFVNAFGKRLLGTNIDRNVDTREISCALEENCICDNDSDCAEKQNCVTLEGSDQNQASIKVCQDTTDISN